MLEHLGILALTGKNVKRDGEFFMNEHLLFCSQLPDFEDFPILTTNNNNFKVTSMENLLIKRNYPPLKRK